MKKIISVIITMILVALLANELTFGATSSSDSKLQQSVSDKIIRFHVLANSDSDEDQKLKLKVRDEVLKYMSPKLKNSKSIQESKLMLRKYDKEIKSVAEKVIKDSGYDYSVNTELSKEGFPVKTYGIITLPQGTYEAYRILIGDAEGQNWWCVMFPPLCFIDITKGEIADEETNAEMKKVLNDDELRFVTNTEEIQLKFKIVELFNKYKRIFLKS